MTAVSSIAVLRRIAFATLLVVLMVRTATANPADDAFRKGRDLFKAGEYAAACAQFETSQRLDPQLGTLFNLAQCHEQIGKIASAYGAYRDIVTKDTNAERRSFANELAEKLAPRVTHVVVQIDGELPPGLVVRIGDRRVVANRPVPIDKGTYEIRVQAFATQTATVDVKIGATEEGRTLTVIIPLTPITQKRRPASLRSNDVERPRSPRKVAGITGVSLGVATLLVGAGFAWHARSSWQEGHSVCGTSCATQTDSDRAYYLQESAVRSSKISNVLFVAGGALVVTGVVLWATAPSAEHAMTVRAHPSPDGGSVTLAGHF